MVKIYIFSQLRDAIRDPWILFIRSLLFQFLNHWICKLFTKKKQKVCVYNRIVRGNSENRKKKKFLSYCSLANLIVYCISSILTNPITIKCVPFNRIIFSSNLYREKSLPNSEISCSCQLTIAIEIALFRSGFYRATNRQRDSCNELVADFIKTKIAFVISTNTG